MSRFNLAITILAVSAALNNAFLSSRITTSSRSFAPFKAKSYLDSLSQQPKSEESTVNNVNDSISIMQEEIAELKESTQVKDDEVVKQLSEETPAAETSVKLAEQTSIETPAVDSANSIAAINIEIEKLESEAATAAEAAVAVLQEESKPEPEETTEEPCDDEVISFTIAAAAASTLGVNTSRNYRATRQTLRESRGKNEKRLNRSSYEKEKSSDKITAIRAKADEQIKIVERDLEGKLVDLQERFDSEVSQPTSQLVSQQKSTCIFSSCYLCVAEVHFLQI
jgi:hypothetical protein